MPLNADSLYCDPFPRATVFKLFDFVWLPFRDGFISLDSLLMQFFKVPLWGFFSFSVFQLILMLSPKRKQTVWGKGGWETEWWVFDLPTLNDNVQIHDLTEKSRIELEDGDSHLKKKNMDRKGNAGHTLVSPHICWKLVPEDYIMVLIHVTWSAKLSSGGFLHSTS